MICRFSEVYTTFSRANLLTKKTLILCAHFLQTLTEIVQDLACDNFANALLAIRLVNLAAFGLIQWFLCQLEQEPRKDRGHCIKIGPIRHES